MTIFKRLFASNANVNNGKLLKSRRARIESLEDRQMLSVTPVEYGAIRELYPNLGLPAQQAEINVIEIAEDAVSIEAIQNAIQSAAQTAKSDLIVVRTSNDYSWLQFDEAADIFTVDCSSKDCGSVSIVAYGAVALTIDGNQYGNIFNVGEEAELKLGGLDMFNADSRSIDDGYGLGGAIFNAGVTTLDNVSIHDCFAINGGALYNSNNGVVAVFNSAFYANEALDGGAVYNANGKVTISTSKLFLNEANYDKDVKAGGNGGAIYNGADLFIDNSVVYANRATYFGGAIYELTAADNSTLDIRNCTIAGNYSATNGSGLFQNQQKWSTISVYNTIICNNYNNMNCVGRLSNSTNNFITFNVNFLQTPNFDYQGKLTNFDTMDLRLSRNSAAINAGSNQRAKEVNLDFNSVDAFGNPRINNNYIDIGACEYANNYNSELTVGSIRVADVLKAPADFQGDLQWRLVDPETGESVAIDGATAKEYVVRAEDLGKQLQVVVTCDGESVATGVYTFDLTVEPRKLKKTTVAVEADCDSIAVNWKEVENAGGYIMYYKEDGADKYSYYGTYADTNCVIEGLAPETTYQVRVKAKTASDAYLNADFTTVAVTTEAVRQLDAPANLVVEAVTAATVTVAWDGVAEAAAYTVVVYNADNVVVDTVMTEETSVIVTGLAAQNAYSIDVYATAPKFYDSEAATVDVETTAKRKLRKNVVKAEAEATQIVLKWNAVEDALKYRVQYKTADSETYTSIDLKDTTIVLTDLEPGTIYDLRVKTIVSIHNAEHLNSDFTVFQVETADAQTALEAAFADLFDELTLL